MEASTTKAIQMVERRAMKIEEGLRGWEICIALGLVREWDDKVECECEFQSTFSKTRSFFLLLSIDSWAFTRLSENKAIYQLLCGLIMIQWHLGV